MSGVVGQRLHQGSLYVALDPAVSAPVIALTGTPPSQPYLVHARWIVSHLEAGDSAFSFRAAGFGPGVSAWQVTPQTAFLVSVTTRDGTATRRRQVSDAAGVLTSISGRRRAGRCTSRSHEGNAMRTKHYVAFAALVILGLVGGLLVMARGLSWR